MKILIVSDTHRYLGNLQTALEEEDLITLNPGSMTYPRQSGRQPSYMVMILDEEGKASFEIKYL